MDTVAYLLIFLQALEVLALVLVAAFWLHSREQDKEIFDCLFQLCFLFHEDEGPGSPPEALLLDEDDAEGTTP